MHGELKLILSVLHSCCIIFHQRTLSDKMPALWGQSGGLFFVCFILLFFVCQSQRFRLWFTARAQCVRRKMNSW